MEVTNVLVIAVGYMEQFTCSLIVGYLDVDDARECFEVIRDFHILPDESIDEVLVIYDYDGIRNIRQYTSEHWG